MITIELDKEDLMSLIRGKRPKTMQDCQNLQGIGLMRYTGNQWNPSWAWEDEGLMQVSEEDLYKLYLTLK